jgi:tRNA 5-methylaminomethyl-2-thiouridine biosynthesis bifunctional protein
MAEPVEWRPDGTPRSARFDDIYRPANGGLEQARHVFLHGCGLPEGWAGQAQWRILETGFGLGLNFLVAWRAWKDDPRRPRMLHYVAAEAWPVAADDIVRSAQANEELHGPARELAAQWFGLTPGAHRLSFEQGHVLLTVHVRDARDMLRSEPFTADSVFLDGFDPQRNPAMWDEPLLKAVARHCRRGTGLATWTATGEVRRGLQSCGFVVRKAEGLPPKRHSTQAVFDPAWEPKGLRTPTPASPANALVIGAGLAGSAVAASLARRGWQVRIVDAASAPAAGASALPVGLLAPHTSPDDNLLSRLSRSGVRITMREASDLLKHGEDWQPCGTLERRPDPLARFPDGEDFAPWQREIAPGVIWHEQAAWIRPAVLVRAWQSLPGITFQGDTPIDDLVRENAAVIVVAAALGSGKLLAGRLPLGAVRGQIAFGNFRGGFDRPPHAINGNGHFIPCGDRWFSGSTYGRGDTDASIREEDSRLNLERLASLVPELVAGVDPLEVHAWAGVRCTSKDRRPLVGEIEPGLLVSTAMGSRGLTFCVLAAELLAARLHDEPLPIDLRLAQAIDVKR